MRLTSLLAALLSSVLLLAACPPPCEGCDDPAPVWETAFELREAGSISSVWGTGPDDVFAVGGAERGTVLHFDGEEWSQMAVPEVPLLVWVYGFSPTDVYAVGTGGGALHYDGEEWTALPTGTDEDLWGVFGFAGDDLWVVGGDVREGEPLLLHYDGNAFTAEPLPATENPVGAHALFKVWGIGDKLFAVGQLGLILERTGGAWVYRPAGEQADDDFVSLWGTSEDHIIAVGGRANARIAVYDGSAWRTEAPTGVGGLNGVFLQAPGKALVGGVFGYIGEYDVASGALVHHDSGTRFDVHALWGDGSGTTYAVGGNFLPPYRGVALQLSP